MKPYVDRQWVERNDRVHTIVKRNFYLSLISGVDIFFKGFISRYTGID
jgi:hypothetical protein